MDEENGSVRAPLKKVAQVHPLTPDGVFYVLSALGVSIPLPYSLRTFIVQFFGTSPAFWTWAHRVGLALFALGTALYAESLLGAVLVMVGPAMYFYRRFVVLTDIPALGLMMAGVAAMQWAPFAGAALIVLGTLFNEKVPIFSAILLWSPLPLIALVIPAILYLMKRRDTWVMPDEGVFTEEVHQIVKWVLSTPPWKVGWETHRDTLTDPTKWLLPLGGLILIFLSPTYGALSALGVALCMSFLATDSVRMYTWAAPAMIANVVLLGWPLTLLAIALSWFASNAKEVRRWV